MYPCRAHEPFKIHDVMPPRIYMHQREYQSALGQSRGRQAAPPAVLALLVGLGNDPVNHAQLHGLFGAQEVVAVCSGKE